MEGLQIPSDGHSDYEDRPGVHAGQSILICKARTPISEERPSVAEGS